MIYNKFAMVQGYKIYNSIYNFYLHEITIIRFFWFLWFFVLFFVVFFNTMGLPAWVSASSSSRGSLPFGTLFRSCYDEPHPEALPSLQE